MQSAGRPSALFPDIGYISTYPPRECGIASFTEDLVAHVHRTPLMGKPVVAAMLAPGESPQRYSPPVAFTACQNSYGDHLRMATFFSDSPAAVVNLQHEFGIFGGERGSWICTTVEHLRKPLVTTLHTVLPKPHPGYREILRYLVVHSARVVVMNPLAYRLLQHDYGVSTDKVVLIWHGAPAPPAESPSQAKQRLGLEGHIVLSTFGLLNRGKGIEYVLQALPELVEQFPQLLYLVLGETHPNVYRSEGESYRRELLTLVEQLRLQEHVRFVNRYLSRSELALFLQATDIYITPYLSEHQIVSGTLTYALAFGKAIITTPYLYAQALCAQGRSILVPFRDSAAIASALRRLLEDPLERLRLQQQALLFGQQLRWEHVGKQYAQLFRELAVQTRRIQVSIPAVSAAFAHVARS